MIENEEAFLNMGCTYDLQCNRFYEFYDFFLNICNFSRIISFFFPVAKIETSTLDLHEILWNYSSVLVSNIKTF